MEIIRTSIAGFSLLVAAVSLAAQTSGAEPKPGKLILREGTPVVLKLAQDVNSRTARPDEPVELALAEPLKVGDALVADVGSRAAGVVVDSAKPNFSGDPGQLVFKLTFLKAGTTRVPIRGMTVENGVYRVLIRGSNAVIKAGAVIQGFVDADTEVEAPGVCPKATAPATQAANKP